MIERSINQSDVGIISPYRKQCEKLTEKCQQLKWTDIQIGSVETFQGQERPIIIVSTVRSRMRDIGFLDNAKVSGQSFNSTNVQSISMDFFLVVILVNCSA